MQIGTNSIAQTAVRSIHLANAAIATASERISSGLRINHASDDSLGMALGNQLKTQIGSMSKAMDNINQGIAMTQAVDSSLSQIVTLLGEMKALAYKAETYGDGGSVSAVYQNAMDEYVAQINTIADNTTWNGTSLMNSYATSYEVQASGISGDTISLPFTEKDMAGLFSSSQLKAQSAISNTDYTAAVDLTSTLDISTTNNAATTAAYFDDVLDTVYAYQSYVGAMASRMTSQSNVLSNISTVYSTAYGNIMNADLAQETANLAAAQIQRDGATAMLTQSNGLNKEIVAFLLKSVTN